MNGPEGKKFQETLKIGENRFLRAEAFAHMGHWQFSPGDEVLFSSDEMNRIYGFDPESHVMTLQNGVDACHPDDLERVQSAFAAAMESGKTFDYEHRILRPDGEVRSIHAITECEFNEDGQVTSMFGVIQDITERKVAEEALRGSEEKLRAIIENSPNGITLKSENGKFLLANNTFANWNGLDVEDIVGKSIRDLYPAHDAAEIEKLDTQTINDNKTIIREWDREFLNGDTRSEIVHKIPVTIGVDEQQLVLTITIDISELKEVEAQLRQSQRMEAVGQLTGGVAHDFNNLLAVVIGHAELLERKVSDDEGGLHSADAIKKAVKRGSSLTGRLLSFSRKQPLSPIAADVSKLVYSLEDMLQRTLGETIAVNVVNTPDLWPVLIDPHQLEDALLNLAINARDAMPKGGNLTIEAANTTLDESHAQQHEEVAPGDYVKIALTDTGSGISSDELAKVFDPFFTTKEFGKGSGLGLSMVYGFIKQSNGHIAIYSEVDHGTTIKLYLPRSRQGVVKEARTGEKKVHARGSEHILVVEDDEMVREIPVDILREQGYGVVETGDGNEAIKLLEGGASFDLLFTDVILPGGMNGTDIAREAVRIQPHIKVIYTTGYAENAVVHNGKQVAGVTLVRKPYRRDELLQTVRETLDG